MSPTLSLVRQGIPLAKNSPSFVGAEPCFEKTGLRKKMEAEISFE